MKIQNNRIRKQNKTPEEIAEALEAIVEPVSLYEPVYSDSSSGDNIYIMDQLSDLSSTDEALLEDISLGEALKALSERERKIIDMRFFKGKTQMEIASEIGISQAQVSRLEKGALERMRKHFWLPRTAGTCWPQSFILSKKGKEKITSFNILFIYFSEF